MAALQDRVTRTIRLRREEAGAAAVEFALLAPLVFFLLFGLFYLLMLFAAQLSLGYATNVAVRYAAIPSNAAGTAYPSDSDVMTKVAASTPFFPEGSCTLDIPPPAGVNQPVSLTVDCEYPNPFGQAANGFRQALFGGDEISPTVALTATAESRRE